MYNRAEINGSQSTLLAHVDDVSVIAKGEEGVDNIMDEIESLFGEVIKSRGRVLSYVGVTLDFRTEESI